MRILHNGLYQRIWVGLLVVLMLSVLMGCSPDEAPVQSAELPQKKNETMAGDETAVSADSDNESNQVDVSMEEAIQIAQIEAEKYYENLKLTEVHSYDNDEIPDISAGESGNREWWYVSLANEDLNYVLILIENGEIASVEKFDNNGNNGLFEFSDVKMTAEEAIQKAKAIGLRGGNPEKEEEWISGYNFKLSYASLIDSPEDIRLFMEVIGISPNGNFAHVDFDAATGELLLAEEKIEHDNGDVEWKTFIQIEGK